MSSESKFFIAAKFFLDDDIELAKDEFLLMKTRIRHGKVSFEDVDVQFKLGNLHIPQDIICGCREDSVDMYIISGIEKKFRLIVKRPETASEIVRKFMSRQSNFLSRYLPNF